MKKELKKIQDKYIESCRRSEPADITRGEWEDIKKLIKNLAKKYPKE